MSPFLTLIMFAFLIYELGSAAWSEEGDLTSVQVTACLFLYRVPLALNRLVFSGMRNVLLPIAVPYRRWERKFILPYYGNDEVSR